MAPFLSEAITTNEQREAFETIIRYLDGISIAVPSDVQQYLDEIRENADVAVTQSASAVLAAAMADPEKYIHDNKEPVSQKLASCSIPVRALVLSNDPSPPFFCIKK